MTINFTVVTIEAFLVVVKVVVITVVVVVVAIVVAIEAVVIALHTFPIGVLFATIAVTLQFELYFAIATFETGRETRKSHTAKDILFIAGIFVQSFSIPAETIINVVIRAHRAAILPGRDALLGATITINTILMCEIT